MCYEVSELVSPFSILSAPLTSCQRRGKRPGRPVIDPQKPNRAMTTRYTLARPWLQPGERPTHTHTHTDQKKRKTRTNPVNPQHGAERVCRIVGTFYGMPTPPPPPLQTIKVTVSSLLGSLFFSFGFMCLFFLLAAVFPAVL